MNIDPIKETSPTLYVRTTETKPTIGFTLTGEVVRTKEEHSYRPATHNEIVAAMHRCGTCADWKEGKYDRGICFNIDAMPVETEKTFGCTKHSEKT